MSASVVPPAPTGADRRGLLAALADTVLGQFAGAGFVLDHGQHVARIGGAVEAQDLHRLGGARLADLFIALIDQSAHATPLAAGHHDVAALERAALDQHGGDRAPALVELGFDDHALGRAVGVGLEVHDLGLQQDVLDQVIEAFPGLGGNRHGLGVAAQAFDDDFVLQELVDHPRRIGAGLVHLVDGHDDRRAGRLGVIDGLDGLGHDPVVGRHHQDDDVGDVGAAGAHGREGRVTGCVEEGDFGAALGLHLIGADVLGDAAVLAAGDIGLTQGVQQRGLAMVNVAHHRHDRRAGDLMIVMILGIEEAQFDVGLGDPHDVMARFVGDQFGGVGVEHVARFDHHALAHHELDDFHGAGRHPLGQVRHGDGVGNDHLALGRASVGGSAAATFFLFALARPPKRSQ